MRSSLILICACFFANCNAVVIEQKNGIVKVDKWGSNKTNIFKRDRKPSMNNIKPTWME